MTGVQTCALPIFTLTAEILAAGYVIALAFYGAERLLNRSARLQG